MPILGINMLLCEGPDEAVMVTQEVDLPPGAVSNLRCILRQENGLSLDGAFLFGNCSLGIVNGIVRHRNLLSKKRGEGVMNGASPSPRYTRNQAFMPEPKREALRSTHGTTSG